MFNFKEFDQKSGTMEEGLSVMNNSVFGYLLGEIPNMIIILNHKRKVVYMNRKFLEIAENFSPEDKHGMKLGECLLCFHATEAELGCGTTPFCKVCGFAKAVNESEKGVKSSGECIITLKNSDTLTFSIQSIPFMHNGGQYFFVSMLDKSDLKARQLLENIFLHDINNSISALTSINELIDELPLLEARTMINELLIRLTDEIHSYRLITDAENYSLSLMVSRVNIDGLIEASVKSLLNNRDLRGRKVEIIKGGLVFNTDETLLRRVLSNTIKNALEASTDQQTVTVYSKIDESGEYNIMVKSQPVIPAEIQLQLFQRSFSTKGKGRGWGAYSIRLLTERYLGGRVRFVSNESDRTIFTITLPSLE
jgi:ParB-like chromosome segregation protein Spo0J